jgi:N6-L-threonylcarbamoyladenine synthase
VLVGATFAKAIAFANNLPFIAINHLEGHALTARLTNNVKFPYLLLLVSGGHCQVLSVTAVGQYELLGSTIDDAIGEAFDKTAKLLDLGFPGGPAIEKAALTGDKDKYKFPKPMAGRPGCDFSFSGLKTAIRYTVQALNSINDQDRADLAASFQATVIAVLQDRCSNAISMFQEKYGVERTFVVSGGVAANMLIRDNLHKMATANKMKFIAPPINLCTDNAAMIAWAGIERLKIGHTDGLDFIPRPRWPLDDSLQKKVNTSK